MAVFKYEELTAFEINKKGLAGAIAVLNLGSIEQHGPHLPVGTDCIIGSAHLLKGLDKTTTSTDFLLLPLMPYSCSVEHMDLPGTITLTAIMVIEMIKKIGESLLRSEVKNIVLSTGHGGNEHVMEVAARELRILGMNAFCIQQFLASIPLGAPEEEIHAGCIETSELMYLGDYVRRDKIRSDMATSKDKWFAMVNGRTCATQAWVAGDIGIDGVCGAPSDATMEIGEKWVTGMSDAIAATLDEIARTLAV